MVRTYNYTPWVIWMMAGLFYLYEYVLRVSPQVVAHELMSLYDLNSAHFGMMSAAYYIAYVPLQLPCGYILDRYGVRIVLSGSTILCTLGALIFAHTDSLLIAYLARFLMGMGSACAYVGCMKVGSEWFPASQFPLIAGLTLMMGQIGASFGTHPFALLVHYFHYKMAMNILVGLGAIVMLGCWIFIPKYTVSKTASRLQQNFFSVFKKIIHTPSYWILGIYGLFMYVGISGFSELWAVMFIMKKYEIHCSIAAFQPILFFIGVALGSPIISSLAQKKNIPFSTMALLGIFGSVAFFIIVWGTIPLFLLSILLFLVGALCGGHVLCFVAAKNNTSSHEQATAMGFINMLVMTSGLLFQPFIGYLLEWGWTGDVDALGIRQYSKEAFQFSLSTVIIVYFCAFLLIAIFYRDNIKKEWQAFKKQKTS